MSPNDPSFHRQGYVEKPLIVFPKNSIGIQHQGKEAFIADSSLINLYNKRQVYQRFAVDSSGDYCHWIEPSEELLQQVKGLKTLFKLPNLSCDLNTYLLHTQLLDNITAKNSTDPLRLEELVIAIVSNMAKSLNIEPQNTLLKPAHTKLTERIKRVIHSSLGENKSLSEIAYEVFSSPYHISRVFKQITGIGINQFRTQIRLKSIYSKIQSGESDLAMLALNHGFSSHSHLSHCFKKYFGFTPSSFKNE